MEQTTTKKTASKYHVIKSFDDLVKEIHEEDLCNSCYGCVSFCSAHHLDAIEVPKGGGPPRYKNKDSCQQCGICYLICPQTHVMDKELNEKFNNTTPLGNWTGVASTRATSQKILDNATDGGVVTAILVHLLETKQIDGAIVARKVGPFNREAYFAVTREELVETAGSHYSISNQVVELERYDTYVTAITQLKKVLNFDHLKIAFVGTPCQINSIRKMQELNILPAHVVKYTFGLFCYMNFSFGIRNRMEMEQKFSFSFKDVEKINIKESMIVQMRDGTTMTIAFPHLKEYAKPACTTCTDFSNVYADISFGGLGSPDGYTTVLRRTEKGEEVYRNALKDGYIEAPDELNNLASKNAMLEKVRACSKKKARRANQKA
ncbi:MAG: Coenzyme F420 hydrogenase/dehydrogenase, beta subunit C-terminal domain [Candidatus Hodarchaeota archaeon]